MWWGIGEREGQREVHALYKETDLKRHEEQADAGAVFASWGHGLILSLAAAKDSVWVCQPWSR